MSTAQDVLNQAHRANDPRVADQLAARAIGLDPDHGPAYGLRGLLAARRGDPIVATHYLRVAYARGDRSEATRAGLAACLAAAGDDGLAARVRSGARLPDALSDFAAGLDGHRAVLRQVLSTRLPPAGQPAFLPGEKRPDAAAARDRPSAPRPAAVRDRQSVPRERPPQPRPGPPPPGQVAAPQRRVTAPDMPSTEPAPRVVRRAIEVPDWLEPTHVATTGGARGSTPDWLEDNTPATGQGAGFTGGGIELATDPGAPTVRVRSPVTGALVDQREIAWQRQDAVMPELGQRQDPLEARPALLAMALEPDALALAVYLPGPVVTAAGGLNPRKLATRVALGLIAGEVVMRDADEPTAPPARIPLRSVKRMEVIEDGRQLSLLMHDNRQMHLDLRDLMRRAPMVASQLVDRLAEGMR